MQSNRYRKDVISSTFYTPFTLIPLEHDSETFITSILLRIILKCSVMPAELNRNHLNFHKAHDIQNVQQKLQLDAISIMSVSIVFFNGAFKLELWSIDLILFGRLNCFDLGFHVIVFRLFIFSS